MKILVPIKRVVDFNVKVRVKADCSDVDLTNVKMSLNPFCEVAIEEALRLKEAGSVTEVVAVSIGPDCVQDQIRTALAMGADRGIHIKTDETPESFSVAKLLASLVGVEQPDIVILGKQAIDSDNNQTGQMLAGLVGFSQGAFASNVTVISNEVKVDREVDGGQQTVYLKLPAVLTADLALNIPRYASLPNIMKARKKPLVTVTPSELGVELIIHQKLLRVDIPSERASGKIVSSVDELINQLRNAEKVI
ncbi:electron transfer flavoprotein subunit beta/FixA family protein [Pseudomonas sp. NPDC087342]|uniref:electron transfer flavoprotein subunit beta/FixA family protein n=1 Tax=Pseudomonas sp. NPDC087342 TaxID=3364437 RepID=UPI003830EDD7